MNDIGPFELLFIVAVEFCTFTSLSVRRQFVNLYIPAVDVAAAGQDSLQHDFSHADATRTSEPGSASSYWIARRIETAEINA